MSDEAYLVVALVAAAIGLVTAIGGLWYEKRRRGR